MHCRLPAGTITPGRGRDRGDQSQVDSEFWIERLNASGYAVYQIEANKNLYLMGRIEDFRQKKEILKILREIWRILHNWISCGRI